MVEVEVRVGGKRVLDVGAGEGTAKDAFPDDEITTLDLPGTGADIEVDLESEEFQALEAGPFDVIWMSHVLEHVHIRKAMDVLKKLYELTAEGGSIYIFVPSLEWAAEKILGEEYVPILAFTIYGAQTDEGQVHYSGYWMDLLRYVVRASGWRVRQAGRSQYIITQTVDDEQRPYEAEQLFIAGVKITPPKTEEESEDGTGQA